MMTIYYLIAPKRKISIDQKTHHKMLTQIWKKKRFVTGDIEPKYINSNIDDIVQSTHFTQVYNGWLKGLINKS